MAARNKLTAQERHIWSLRFVILLFFILIAIGITQIKTKLDEITVHVPPDLSQGATLKGGQIDKTTVFTFANYVMTSLNEWSNSGAVDFPALITSYACVLTPAFKAYLERTLDQKRTDGELDRVRSANRLGAYTDDHINVRGSNTWVAWIDLAILETINGVPVKDTNIRYPVRVVRDDRTCNPMKLAIDGYEYEPERI